MKKLLTSILFVLIACSVSYADQEVASGQVVLSTTASSIQSVPKSTYPEFKYWEAIISFEFGAGGLAEAYWSCYETPVASTKKGHVVSESIPYVILHAPERINNFKVVEGVSSEVTMYYTIFGSSK